MVHVESYKHVLFKHTERYLFDEINLQLSFVALGGDCTAGTECDAIPHAECASQKCVCSSGYTTNSQATECGKDNTSSMKHTMQYRTTPV